MGLFGRRASPPIVTGLLCPGCKAPLIDVGGSWRICTNFSIADPRETCVYAVLRPKTYHLVLARWQQIPPEISARITAACDARMRELNPEYGKLN